MSGTPATSSQGTGQAGATGAAVEPAHRARCHLDDLLEQRGTASSEPAARAGVIVVDQVVLENGGARAVRFSTPTSSCDVLGCDPGPARHRAGATR